MSRGQLTCTILLSCMDLQSAFGLGMCTTVTLCLVHNMTQQDRYVGYDGCDTTHRMNRTIFYSSYRNWRNNPNYCEL